MIQAYNIFKSFGDHVVLKDVSASFDKGKTNLIIGKSGSGKTVFMKCLAGLFDVDQGKIMYDDINATDIHEKEKKKLRRDIGMLFQGGALFDSLTVEENVMFPLTMFTKKSLKEKLDRVNFCLEHVNLEDANKLFPAELSGGMTKRVAIARAIALNPKYLFCDEPNSGLDPNTADLIDDLITSLTKEFNMTTIINTHDMNSVLKMGDKITFLYKGELWWEGDKDQILTTENKELNDFVFSMELTQRLKKSVS